MNKTPNEGTSFLEEILNLLLDIERTQVIFCPPFTGIPGLNKIIKGERFSLGAQNCHWENDGAFTGEISPHMLSAIGVEFVIIGHSERRHIFGETNEMINRKINAVLSGGMKPIFCIGETLQERKNLETEKILVRQLEEGLSKVESLEDIILAYEPVWAIGTGENAYPQQLEQANAIIRTWVRHNYGNNMEDNIQILYGGSVKEDNATDLIKTEGVDGFLIGGASIDAQSFSSIIHQVENLN